jgi:Raf kinase inhibitor-like YbhB/YbcL family protein
VLRVLVMTSFLAALASCGDAEGPIGPAVPEGLDEFELSSPAFGEGAPIPEEFSCDGADVSPPLEWGGVPEGTVELLLTVQDPDAPNGVFTHWTVYSIDPEARSLPKDGVPEGALQGLNDFRQPGYGGPCPPPGPAHRYIFTLAALDEPSDLEAGAPPEAVDGVLQRARATTTLTGTYPG